MNKKFLFIPTLLLATTSSINLWASDTNEGITYWGWAGPYTEPTEQEIAANKRLLQSLINDTEQAKITPASQQAKKHITTALTKSDEIDETSHKILGMLESLETNPDNVSISDMQHYLNRALARLGKPVTDTQRKERTWTPEEEAELDQFIAKNEKLVDEFDEYLDELKKSTLRIAIKEHQK